MHWRYPSRAAHLLDQSTNIITLMTSIFTGTACYVSTDGSISSLQSRGQWWHLRWRPTGVRRQTVWLFLEDLGLVSEDESKMINNIHKSSRREDPILINSTMFMKLFSLNNRKYLIRRPTRETKQAPTLHFLNVEWVSNQLSFLNFLWWMDFLWGWVVFWFSMESFLSY